MLNRASEVRVPATQTSNWPAPSQGWVQSGNVVLAPKDQAEVLDNFFVTAQGISLRGGSQLFADLGAQAIRLFVYQGGGTEKFFGSSQTKIEEITTGSAVTVRSGLGSGDWSVTQISTAGGEFMAGVNGVDVGWTYNGTSFTDMTWTGVNTADLNQIWLFKERLFAIEKDTSKVWYLPVESIGGTASSINLGGVLRRGGKLLYGATWSLDSGAGLDDVCLFVSEVGELAVYEGSDPADINTWQLVGVYDIAQPLDKHAFFKAGGDLMVMTEDGIVAVSEAIRKDRAALIGDAITFPIEDAWNEVITQRTSSEPITATLWQSQTALLIGTPDRYRGRPVSFIANARTGAWSRITGWDVQCSAVFQDRLFFADITGKVFEANVGGSDNGVSYTGTWVPKFEPGSNLRQASATGVTYRAREELSGTLDAHADYNVGLLIEPTSAPALQDAALWGSGVWGTFVWQDANALNTYTGWQAAYANGYALTPSLAITSNQTQRIPFEPLILRLRHETGYAL